MGGEHPDWLPEGWRVSVKIRSFGRKDKYYIHPCNGLTFNSKPEVLRYLEGSKTLRKPKKSIKPGITRTAAENLPPGWIKEIRTERRHGKIRSNPYYIDPVSRQCFRSLQEVFRYLKFKDSGEAKCEPKDKGPISMELGDYSQSESAQSKELSLVEKKRDKNSTGHESVKSDPKPVTVNFPEDNHLEHTPDDRQAIERPDYIQPVKRVKRRVDRMMKIENLADRKGDKSSDVDNHLEQKDDPQAIELPDKLQPVKTVKRREDKMTKIENLVDNKANTSANVDNHLLQKADDSKVIELPDELQPLEGVKRCADRMMKTENLADNKANKSANVENHLEQREDGSEAIELPDKLQPVKRVKRCADRMMKIENLADNKADKSTNMDQRSKSALNVDVPESIEKPVVEQKGKEDDSVVRNLPKKLPQVNGKGWFNSGMRQNTRLASSKLKDNVTKDHPVQSVLEAVSGKKISSPDNNGLQQRRKKSSCTGEFQEQQTQAREDNRKNSKWTSDFPRRSSKRLACLEVDPSTKVKTSYKDEASAQFSGEEETDTTNNSEPSDEPEIEDSNKHPLTCRTEDPTHNSKKSPIADKNLSSLEEHKDIGFDCKEDQKDEKHPSPPLGHLLMDPCIEFAIKTLIGVIPIEDICEVGEPFSGFA